MKAFELTGEVDEQRHLHLELPAEAQPGQARVIVLLPETMADEAGALWMQGVAREWAAELSDPREDIYTLSDGEPLDAAR